MVNIEWIIFFFIWKAQMVSGNHLLMNMHVVCSKQLKLQHTDGQWQIIFNQKMEIFYVVNMI